MAMNVTLRQLRYLVALADTGHFGRAAERVHVSQPALSVQIRELESALGAALIERDSRVARPTRLGREVLARARRVLAEVDGIERAAQSDLAPPLHLGLIPTVAPYLLPEALPMLRASDLTLDIRVREAQTARLLAELAEGTLDAAVIALPSGAPGLDERPLFRDRFLLAGSEAMLAGAGSFSPTEIDPDRLMLLDEGHCLADQALDVCGLDRRNTRVDLGASSLATLTSLAAQGFGLTLVPEIAAAAETRPGLRLSRFALPEPFRTVGLVCRRATAGEPWVQLLADLLAEAATRVLLKVQLPGGNNP